MAGPQRWGGRPVNDSPQSIECRSYTFARAHPVVIGKIGGYSLPIQLSPVQLLVLITGFLVLLWTRALWAHFPGTLNLLVQVLVPVGLAWTLRHLRVEGRSPIRMGVALLNYAATPRDGQVGGRPYREGGCRPLRGARVFVAELEAPRQGRVEEDWGDAPASSRRRGGAG